jgi:peptide-methionine (R)-S-oxide reductase
MKAMARIEKTEAEWSRELSPEQVAVARQGGTEPAFTGLYHDCKEPGTYRCVCCGTALFSSDAKFDSGSGWPSYWAPISDDVVTTHEDRSHGTRRVEVRCATCDAHLGHVFPDGPRPTGLRYCINSVCLELEPKPR